jgi:hypothetical protein
MIGGQVQPNCQRELNRLSQSLQTRGTGAWFKNIFCGWNKTTDACAAAAVNHRAEIWITPAACIHPAASILIS